VLLYALGEQPTSVPALHIFSRLEIAELANLALHAYSSFTRDTFMLQSIRYARLAF